jgi:hypothetical protein
MTADHKIAEPESEKPDRSSSIAPVKSPNAFQSLFWLTTPKCNCEMNSGDAIRADRSSPSEKELEQQYESKRNDKMNEENNIDANRNNSADKQKHRNHNRNSQSEEKDTTNNGRRNLQHYGSGQR